MGLTSHYAGNVQNIYITFRSCHLTTAGRSTTGPITEPVTRPDQPSSLLTFMDFKLVNATGFFNLHTWILFKTRLNLQMKYNFSYALKFPNPAPQELRPGWDQRHCRVYLFEGRFEGTNISLQVGLTSLNIPILSKTENNGRAKVLMGRNHFSMLWRTHGEMTALTPGMTLLIMIIGTFSYLYKCLLSDSKECDKAKWIL